VDTLAGTKSRKSKKLLFFFPRFLPKKYNQNLNYKKIQIGTRLYNHNPMMQEAYQATNQQEQDEYQQVTYHRIEELESYGQ